VCGWVQLVTRKGEVRACVGELHDMRTSSQAIALACTAGQCTCTRNKRGRTYLCWKQTKQSCMPDTQCHRLDRPDTAKQLATRACNVAHTSTLHLDVHALRPVDHCAGHPCNQETKLLTNSAGIMTYAGYQGALACYLSPFQQPVRHVRTL
jgi:hypothetical protein